MLAFALIFALTAHSALAKPTGNCIFMCEAQPGAASAPYVQQPSFGAPSGAYQTPSFGSPSGAYHAPSFGAPSGTYMSPSYGSVGTGFGFSQPRSSRLEDFGTVPVYPQPAHQEVVSQQIPVQPEINGLFTHSSSKSSYESNNGFLQIHQPGVSKTVISEPMRTQPIRAPRPARICQDYYDPCNY